VSALPIHQGDQVQGRHRLAGSLEVEVTDGLDFDQILDVRETGEFDCPLGRISGAKLIPLGSLADRTGELATNQPIVAVCRAGGRSARATKILLQAGFSDIANLAGGMLRWRAQGYPVEGGRD